MSIHGSPNWDDRPDDDGLRADSLDEMPLQRDIDRPREPTCVPCLTCGKMISEFAIRCHRCGAYVMGRAQRGVPAWLFFTVLVLIGASAIALIRSIN